MAPIILIGAITWFFVLKSGVHATLAGVVAAFCIPLTDKWGKSPLQRLEAALSPCVLHLIVPLFAVANAGVLLSGLSFADLFRPFPLGIAAGLVLGKQIGVFGTSWLMVRSSLARLPK